MVIFMPFYLLKNKIKTFVAEFLRELNASYATLRRTKVLVRFLG